MIEKICARLEELYDRNDRQKRTAYEEQDWEKFDLFMHRNEGVYSALAIVQEVAKEYGNGWIPFEMREMDEEEKRCNGVEDGYILNCPLPDEDEEILVTYSNGTVDVDIFMRDGNECYLDSGNDLVTEAIAWRKKPAPYQKG